MAENKSKQNHRGPMAVAQKAKDFKGSIKKMLNYGKRYKKWFIFAICCAFIGTILNLVGPNVIEKVTDTIFGAIDIEAKIVKKINLSRIYKFAGILICLYLIGATLNYAQKFIMATITQRYQIRIRRDISNKINKVPLKYFDNTTYGDILSRVTNDADTMGETMNHSLSTIVTSVVMLVGSLLMMLLKSPLLTVAVIISTFLGFSLMMIVVKISQKHFIAQQNYLGELNGHIEEVYSGHQVLNVYNAQVEAKQKFNTINDNLYKSAWKSQFLSGLMQPIMAFIGNLAYCVVCVIGVIMILDNKLTFGQVSAFMIYARMFINPLSQIAQTFSQVQTMVASGERIFEFLDAEELEDESMKTTTLTKVKGDVTFKNVKFGYNQDKEIIHDFSCEVKAGNKVAIVGKTGAGKTTLINLLMRFYEIKDGTILIDGVDTKSLTRENVHDLFGMVLQDTWIFEATVKENLVYNKTGVTDEEIKSACKACGIHSFIKNLPKGYDTVLDDNTSISAGQKQLLTIARAMIQNNPMLILDEATSSVDTRTEFLIQKAMDNLSKGRTSFVIAHRLSTIKNADMILVMENGDVVESGNHKELLKLGGAYASLYNSQFEE